MVSVVKRNMLVSETEQQDFEDDLLKITETLLQETAGQNLQRQITLTSHLERQLGLDSLGKVELFHRIEQQFDRHLPDDILVTADTLADILRALRSADETPSLDAEHSQSWQAHTATSYNDFLLAETLTESLSQWAAKSGERTHIYFRQADEPEIAISYAQLYQGARRMAQALLDKGIEHGDTVAIMLPTSEDFFYTFFAVLLAGGVPVPIYPPFRPDQIEEYVARESHILQNAQVRFLITFDQAERLSKLLRISIPSLSAVLKAIDLRQSTKLSPDKPISPDEPALIQYTSGSTSDPKGVLLTHANLVANIRSFGEAIALKQTDVCVSWLPLYHDMGLIGTWLGALYHGVPIVIMSPLDFLRKPERWLQAIHQHQATVSAAPNFAYELCIQKIEDSALEGLDLSSWRLTFNGAEAVNPETIRRFHERFSAYGFRETAMFPVYGLAESSVALCFPPIDRKPHTDKVQRHLFETEQRAVAVTASDEPHYAFVSCGRAIVHHELRIIDSECQTLPERHIGTIVFKGPSSTSGYYRNPEATAAITIDDWLDSGDLGYIADGELYITGRKKDLIVKGGRNFYAQEIEEVTSHIPAVRAGCVAAFGVQDEQKGTEKIVIVAEVHPQNSDKYALIKQQIIERVKDIIGIPPDVVELILPRTLPKTSSGKIRRSTCKQLFLDGKLNEKPTPVWMQLARFTGRTLGGILWKSGRTLLSIAYSAYVYALAALVVPLLFAVMIIMPKTLKRPTFKYLIKLWVFLCGWRVRVQGAKHLTACQAKIFVINHASYIDILLAISCLPSDIVFVAKKETLDFPLVGYFVKKMGHVTVDRENSRKSLLEMRSIFRVLRAGQSVVIYPEGTFTRHSGLRPFKMGAFKVAVETKKPIVPIAMTNTREILSGATGLFWPKCVDVSIGEPIVPTADTWDEAVRLHDEAKAFIAANCGETVLPIKRAFIPQSF